MRRSGRNAGVLRFAQNDGALVVVLSKNDKSKDKNKSKSKRKLWFSLKDATLRAKCGGSSLRSE